MKEFVWDISPQTTLEFKMNNHWAFYTYQSACIAVGFSLFDATRPRNEYTINFTQAFCINLNQGVRYDLLLKH